MCECSTASNAVLLCFSHMSWMDFLESSLVTQFCGTPKSCCSWWMNIQTTHLLLFRKWVDLIPQLLQLHVDTSLGQMLTLNNSRCIHLELCVKIKICLCICILLLYFGQVKIIQQHRKKESIIIKKNKVNSRKIIINNISKTE